MESPGDDHQQHTRGQGRHLGTRRPHLGGSQPGRHPVQQREEQGRPHEDHQGAEAVPAGRSVGQSLPAHPHLLDAGP